MGVRVREGLVRWRGAAYAGACALGWWAPWDRWLRLDGSGPNAHVWGVLSVGLSQTGAVSIGVAFEIVLAIGIACAAAGAWLRTRAAAHGGDGAARYAGTCLHAVALALLMPVSGAVFAVVCVAVVGWFTRRPETGAGWSRAALGEVYTWAVAGSFAVAGWWYNADLLVRCVLVSAGVGLVVRGLIGPGARIGDHDAAQSVTPHAGE